MVPTGGHEDGQFSPSELKRDISAALQLNEHCYAQLIGEQALHSPRQGGGARSSEVSREHVNIVCEIRARLSHAMDKATHFFENSIELLATIASLKRDSLIYQQEQEEKNRLMEGRITCLLDIVREQQESLDKKQETLALKGIWANLLRVSPDGKVRYPAIHRRQGRSTAEKKEDEMNIKTNGKLGRDLDDHAANVITWLSLQCAQEADGQQNLSPERSPFKKVMRKSSSSSRNDGPTSEWLNGICTVSELVSKVGELFQAVHNATNISEEENSRMRVKLQEMSAICTALRREREEKDFENERWKDALSVLQRDHDYSSNQLEALIEENQKLKALCEDQKRSSDSWRGKCHEILDAVEKTSDVTSRYSEECSSRDSSSAVRHNNSTSRSVSYSPQQRYLFSPHDTPSTHKVGADGSHHLIEESRKNGLATHKYFDEQSDVFMLSPPTPFVVDGKNSVIENDTLGSEGPRNEFHLVDANSSSKKISNTGANTSPYKETISKLEPIDPRELDDSTLYRMLLEAENEIDELHSSGHEAVVESVSEHKTGESNVVRTKLEKNVPKEGCLSITKRSPKRSSENTHSDESASSYVTPNKASLSSARFPRNWSISKSVTKAKWNEHFTKREEQHCVPTTSNIYDVVLQRYRDTGLLSLPDHSVKTGAIPSKSAGYSDRMPISPIPLSQNSR